MSPRHVCTAQLLAYRVTGITKSRLSRQGYVSCPRDKVQRVLRPPCYALVPQPQADNVLREGTLVPQSSPTYISYAHCLLFLARQRW